jgi:exonuclease III
MFEKPLTLASLNVRGLKSNNAKPKQIKAWLGSLNNPPQIVLLQEHHLGDLETRNPARGVEFWKGEAFWNKGIPMGCSQRLGAGTAILLDKNAAPYLVDHGILVPGRAQFITLQPPGEGSLTIINVYAPTLSGDRAQLWSKVESASLASDHYILGGDLNHQEPKDANSSNARQRTRRETSAWHAMTLKLGLSDAWALDSFHKLSKKTFTYDNGQQGPSSVLTRIDKFLVSQSVEERGGQIEITPSLGRSRTIPLSQSKFGDNNGLNKGTARATLISPS